jgi:phosphonate transport system substrate-binding protein
MIELSRLWGYSVEAQVSIQDSIREIQEDMERENLEIITVLSEEYLLLKDRTNYVPLFVPQRGGHPQEQVVLLVRRDSNVGKIHDLKGGSVAAPKMPGEALGRMWFEVLLARNGLEESSQFLSGIESFRNASRAILSVFFRKMDACIVPRLDFETAAELNPQVAKQLQVIETSLPLTVSVICVRKGSWLGKEDLLSAMKELHTNPRGEQMLMMFKTERLASFDPAYLEGTQDISDDYQRLEQIRRGITEVRMEGRPQ